MAGCESPEYTKILQSDVTHVDFDGDGMFDRLTAAVYMHLQREFESQRIASTEYARVYSETLVATMEQSLQFVLQRCKIMAESDLLRTQASVALQQLKNAEREAELIAAQIRKVEAETELLQQRTRTELAQIDGSGVKPDSVIGKQIVLYGRQADGFLRDAEQKAAQIFAQSYNVALSTDKDVDPAASGLDAANTNTAMTTLLNGLVSP